MTSGYLNIYGRPQDGRIRNAALAFNIPYTTTLSGATATALAVEAMKEGELNVRSLQEYHSGEQGVSNE